MRGGKQTLVCSRTVHSSTVVVHLKKPMNQEKTVCIECESDYFKNSSEMA
ncbi:hypothetical protein SAMN05444148_2846, partial [Winogradskyella jejuensis]